MSESGYNDSSLKFKYENYDDEDFEDSRNYEPRTSKKSPKRLDRLEENY